MQLSMKSDFEDVQLASVLLHVATVVISQQQSNQQMSNFMQFLCPSEKLKAIFFPGAMKKVETETECTTTAICKCSQQLVQNLQNDTHQIKCPTCGRIFPEPAMPDAKNEINETDNPIGYTYPSVLQSWKNLEKPGNISVVSRSIIDFLVHGCLYIAFEIFPEKFKKVSLCSVDKLESRLMELWSALPKILRANPQDTCVLLHCIIKEISPVLTDPQYTCVSAPERDQQEREIHRSVERLLENTALSKKQFLQDSYAALGLQAESLEHQLQELDNIDKNTCKLLPRSSRQKRPPSFDDLKACFCDHQSHNPEHFPFLHLVLSRYNSLKYVGYLPSLLHWNSLVSSQLSQQRAKRKQANKPISSLIQADSNTVKLWLAFKEAFKYVCDGWTELTGETTRPEYITQDTRIIQCLIMPKGTDQNTLSRMIKTLQGIQNSFLVQTLEIAVTTYCPAISFLIKDNYLAALPTKPLNQVKKKDVITSPWNDKCLCYNDINTEYGHGTEISYDLNQIEMDVALSTVVNKMVLTDGCAFEGFIFADDLYHSSTNILEKIASKVKQEALPKDTANLVIQRDKRKHGTFTNDILQQIEVIMGLLKRTSGDPDITLQDFINEWSSIITIESPELFASIKLKHIVALYQQLEVLLAAATIQTLGEEYRIKLPTNSQLELQKCCMDWPGDVLIQVRDILKRFVFRFLRARQDFEPDCNKRLRDLLRDMTGYDRVLPLLHREMKLCHIVNLLEFFDKTIKVSTCKIKLTFNKVNIVKMFYLLTGLMNIS